MAKSKRSVRQPQTKLSPREHGLRAFQAGRFTEALSAWTPLGSSDPAVRKAMAEAHFRRALGVAGGDPLSDLRRAIELTPDDTRFPFHLGRLLHRAGDRAAAEGHYRAVLAREPGHTAAAKLLALLSIEQQPNSSLETMPGMSPTAQAWLAPAVALLRGQSPPTDESAMGALWRGMGQIASGDPAAATATLADERSLPSAALHALRRSFRGLAAAAAGDEEEAFKHWSKLFDSGAHPPGLEDNFAALLYARLAARWAADDLAAATDLAERWAAVSGSAAFDELRLLVLDRSARAAADAGDWARATARWEAARQILSRSSGQSLGSPRSLLHNLALAYERLEQWDQAAEAWRAMLRTRPRKRADAADPQEDQRWAWVRARIIKCYREAGRPDEAVTVFRQMIKLEPNDLDLRIELANALLENEQERAAQNELKRVLAIDPHHPEAVLRYALAISERWYFGEAQQLVRAMAAHHAAKPEIQRRAAEIFMYHGTEYSRYGNFQEAYKSFVEGERYDPSNPHFALNQARMLIAARRPPDTAALIERALSVGSERSEIWALAVETWMMANDLAQTQALIARFAQERSPNATDYMNLGFQMMMRAIPPPSPSFMRLGTPPPPVDTPWTQLAIAQLDQAIALSANDPSTPKEIARFLLVPLPAKALPFVERAVALTPDDPDALILKGMALGLNDRVNEAKAVLQQAAQLARKQGRSDLQAQARDLRQVVGTPMLHMMLGAALNDALNPEDLKDMLDDLF